MIKIEIYRGFEYLVIGNDYPVKIGLRKIKIILENIDEIKQFVKDFDNGKFRSDFKIKNK